MNEEILIEVTSSSQLIELLSKKYSGNEPQYLSSVRYPSSIIFFNSKKDYQEFLNQAPWDRILLTSIVDELDNLSCYRIKKWFNEAISKAKQNPMIIVPVTEYIRICDKKEINRKTSDNIFLSLVQAESSKLIVPMLDFYSNYHSFFDQFFHKNRMAEVFSVVTPGNEDPEIEIILDRTGRIPLKNYTPINLIKGWLNLWETGEIAELENLLIQNNKIIDAIENNGISVPKIRKYLINDIRDYIAFEYKIPTNAFRIRPTNDVLEKILSILSFGDRPKNWDSVVNRILGDTSNFEKLFFQLWNGDSNIDSDVQRWFWLNEAKSKEFDSKFFNNIIRETDDPESLLDNIYLKGLHQEIAPVDELKERRRLLLQFSQPLFKTDKGTLKKYFQEMEDSLNQNDILNRITCVFDFERRSLIENIIINLKDPNGLNQAKIEILQESWPALSTYVEKALTRYDAWPLITEDFDTFIDIYISNYIISKLVYDSPNDTILDMQKSIVNNWNGFISALKIGKIPKSTNKTLNDQILHDGFILLDGVGYEWAVVLQNLLEFRGWKIKKIGPLISELPSDSSHFLLDNYYEKITKFDENLHKPYRYPSSIITEISLLEDIVEYIHQYYRGKDAPFWIISDHGATVFARKGKPKKYSYIKKKEHGGRYGLINPSKRIENELIHIEKNSNSRCYAISLNYDNLGDTSPQGEAHGGGTVEEILCLSLLCIPPKIDSQLEHISILTEKNSYSALEEELKIKISGNIEEKIQEIELRINKSLKFPISTQYLELRTITLPIKLLKEHGLQHGHNELQFIFNKTINASCKLEIISGSDKTGFDEVFNL